MPLRLRRSHYQQFSEFELGRVIDLRESLLSAVLQKNLAGMYSLCMSFNNNDQGKVLPQETRVPSGYVALLRGGNSVFGVKLWPIVLRLQQKFIQGLLRARPLVACIPLTPLSSNLTPLPFAATVSS